MKLLHIDSSILGENSASRQITSRIVARLCAQASDMAVTRRDLAAAPLAHLSGAHVAVAHGAEPATAELAADIAAGMVQLEEFIAADIVVIGAPMYNLTLPSQLKAWIDRILVAGRTFRYTPEGPVGMAGAKRVIIAVTRGGFYGKGTAGHAMEHLEAYLRTIFAFMGVTRLEFVIAEGIAVGPDQREQAISAALRHAEALAAG